MAQRVAILLAAGVSSRMNTRLPKVLHEVTGRPMLAYVLDEFRIVGVDRIYVILGFGAEQVKERFADAPDIVWVQQAQQLGTAHAVMCCREHLESFSGETLILCGDGPLIRAKTLQMLVEKHQAEQSTATLATGGSRRSDGYDASSATLRQHPGLVEDRDCTPASGRSGSEPELLLFTPRSVRALEKVQPNNVKQEYYLTDALSVMIASGHKVVAITAVRPEEAVGVNSRAQLSVASKIMQHRVQQELMENGVTIVDPDNTWIDARAQIGQDTVIEPFVYIHGEVRIGQACRIGPFPFSGNGT